MYWFACLVAMTTAVLLARLLLVQVRKLLEEVAGVVRTWRAVRRDLARTLDPPEGEPAGLSRKPTPRNAELRASPLLRVPNSRETPTASIHQTEASLRHASMAPAAGSGGQRRRAR